MKTLQKFIPPVLMPALLSIKRALRPNEGRLFDGDDLIYKELASELFDGGGHYVEFGVGASTIWLSNNSNAEVHGVDSSKEWIDFVKARINSQTAQFHHIDLGPLGSHGTPITYDRLGSFESYSNSIWSQTANAKLVLVDGRFRVACFIKALMNTSFGTNIIFDDYFSRPQYSIVENLLLPTNRCGDQAIFQNQQIDQKLANELYNCFKFNWG